MSVMMIMTNDDDSEGKLWVCFVLYRQRLPDVKVKRKKRTKQYNQSINQSLLVLLVHTEKQIKG